MEDAIDATYGITNCTLVGDRCLDKRDSRICQRLLEIGQSASLQIVEDADLPRVMCKELIDKMRAHEARAADDGKCLT